MSTTVVYVKMDLEHTFIGIKMDEKSGGELNLPHITILKTVFIIF